VTQPTLFADMGAKAPRPVKAARPRTKRRPKPKLSADAPVEYRTDYTLMGDKVLCRRWILTFPAPAKMLSANSRPYWRTARANAKEWREAVYLHAKAAKLPTGLRKVRIDFVLRFPTAAKHDAGNYYTTVVKPAVDAVGPQRIQQVKKGARAGQTVVEVGHGLIRDDTPEFLEGPFATVGPKVDDRKVFPFGQVVVTITDLSGEVAA
jgi:hypothetical protein